MEGESPKEEKPKRARASWLGEILVRRPQPAEGKPLKRSRRGRKPKGTGYRVILRRHRYGMANRKRGSQRREVQAISARSSSEGF